MSIFVLFSSVLHKNVNINPASVKQAITSSAIRLPHANMFEQGRVSTKFVLASDF